MCDGARCPPTQHQANPTTRSVITIQSQVRGWLACKLYTEVTRQQKAVQHEYKLLACRRHLLRERYFMRNLVRKMASHTAEIIVIQRSLRRRLSNKRSRTLASAVAIQCSVRCWLAAQTAAEKRELKQQRYLRSQLQGAKRGHRRQNLHQDHCFPNFADDVACFSVDHADCSLVWGRSQVSERPSFFSWLFSGPSRDSSPLGLVRTQDEDKEPGV